MNKFAFLTILALITLSGCWLQDFNENLAYNMIGQNVDTELTVEWEAKALYSQKKGDFSKSEWEKGPCLGRINDQWVVDMVHRPRIESDDYMSNQCQEYYDSDTVNHYVLLDLNNGSVVTKK